MADHVARPPRLDLWVLITESWYYALRNMAGDWGKENGMAPYMSNGAMAVAALYLGFTIEYIDGAERFA